MLGCREGLHGVIAHAVGEGCGHGGGKTGVIAQEIVDTFPELVRGTDGQYTVAYSKLSVYILKALQEQHEEIDLLEKEILTLLATEQK